METLGESIFYKAVEKRHAKTVARLLELYVNVNLQVTAMGDDYGNTALHTLASGLHAGEDRVLKCQQKKLNGNHKFHYLFIGNFK